MIKLVTEQQFKFGVENIIPFAGKVKISDKGEIEVEDDIAQDIVDSDCGFNYPSDKSKKEETTTTTTTIAETTTTTTEVPTTTTTTEATDLLQGSGAPGLEGGDQSTLQGDGLEVESLQDSKEDNTPSLDAIKVALQENTLTQLKEMAKPFESKEWRALSKDKLIEYLISKM